MTQSFNAVLRVISTIFYQLAGFILAAFYITYRFFFPHREGSHPLSVFFRRIFEDRKARLNWGVFLLGLILTVNFIFPFGNHSLINEGASNLVLAASEKELEEAITTETTYQKPIQGFLSQGFWPYHQAVDISTNFGEKVYPIGQGKVINTEATQWGYGLFIVIDHGNGYRSLYAHLQEIKVKPGDEVNKNTLIGSVGLTGWTTGPHLHLEIYGKDGNLNPAEVVPGILPQLAYIK